MKKPLLPLLGLGCVLAFIWFATRSPKEIPASTPTKSTGRKITTTRQTFVEASPEAHPLAQAYPTPPEPTYASIYLSEDKALAQGRDFERGERHNIVLDNGIHLGDDTNFLSHFEEGRLMGMYISPEQVSSNVFDAVTIGLDATIPETSSLTIEYRSRPEDGAWTTWHELSPTQINELMLTPMPAQRVQYRLTLLASSVAESPKVRAVQVQTRNTREFPAHTTGSFSGDPGSFTAISRPE
jgi:hypothetical protein